MTLQAFVHDFVTFWVVIDPIAVLPVFLALTADHTPAERRKIAVETILVAFAVIAFFIGVGQIILDTMGISLRAFQIAGGVVLFLFAVSLVLGDPVPVRADDRPGAQRTAVAVYPLGIPTISGPGTMLTAMLLTDNERFGPMEQVDTAISAVAVLVILLGMLFAADPITRAIGTGGANILRRIMGMILATVAVNTVLGALGSWLGHPRL